MDNEANHVQGYQSFIRNSDTVRHDKLEHVVDVRDPQTIDWSRIVGGRAAVVIALVGDVAISVGVYVIDQCDRSRPLVLGPGRAEDLVKRAVANRRILHETRCISQRYPAVRMMFSVRLSRKFRFPALLKHIPATAPWTHHSGGVNEVRLRIRVLEVVIDYPAGRFDRSPHVQQNRIASHKCELVFLHPHGRAEIILD